MQRDKTSKIHSQILDFLLKWRAMHKGFTFTLRRSDISERLSKGYWFHGSEYYLTVSFWTGTDWQRKVPNLGLLFNLRTGRIFFQFSCRDSQEKELLLRKKLEKIGLRPIRKGLYVDENFRTTQRGYISALRDFLSTTKVQVDEIVRSVERKMKKIENGIGFIDEKDFKASLSKIDAYRKKKSLARNEVLLTGIHVKGFGPIKRIRIDKIPASCKWIFITGENGSGKTNVLRAISLGLAIRPQIQFRYQSDYEIKIELKVDNRKVVIRRKGNGGGSVARRKLPSKGFVAFGPIRLNVHENRNESKHESIRTSFMHPELPLFSTNARLFDIGYVFNRQFAISKSLRADRSRLDNIVDAITTICEDITNIEFGKRVEYFDINSQRGVTFDQLATGYKSIVAMISHLMLVLFDQQPEVLDPSELEGVILIDEIDLHFHPKMQRQLVIKLSEIFPRLQFIVSTHSPIPLLGAPKDSLIFKASRDKKRGVCLERLDEKVMYDRLLPNALLTSPIFGLDDITPVSHDKKVPLQTADDFARVEFSQLLDKVISSYLTDEKEMQIRSLFKK